MAVITHRGKCMTTLTKGGRAQSSKVSYISGDKVYYLKVDLNMLKTCCRY